MSKVYILTEEDFELLTSAIDRDPRWGASGGTSQILNEQEREAHDRAHSFFNYQVHTWLSKVKK